MLRFVCVCTRRYGASLRFVELGLLGLQCRSKRAELLLLAMKCGIERLPLPSLRFVGRGERLRLRLQERPLPERREAEGGQRWGGRVLGMGRQATDGMGWDA